MGAAETSTHWTALGSPRGLSRWNLDSTSYDASLFSNMRTIDRDSVSFSFFKVIMALTFFPFPPQPLFFFGIVYVRFLLLFHTVIVGERKYF